MIVRYDAVTLDGEQHTNTVTQHNGPTPQAVIALIEAGFRDITMTHWDGSTWTWNESEQA